MGKGGTEINYPQQPTYGESLRSSLQAQIDLAPELFAAEASQQYGRPAYAQMETDILRDTLLGQQRFVPDDPAFAPTQPATTPAFAPTQPAIGGGWGTLSPEDQAAQSQEMQSLWKLGTSMMAGDFSRNQFGDSTTESQIKGLQARGYLRPEITMQDRYDTGVQSEIRDAARQFMVDSGQESAIGQKHMALNPPTNWGQLYDTRLSSIGQPAQSMQFGAPTGLVDARSGDVAQSYLGAMGEQQRGATSQWAKDVRSGAFTPQRLISEFGVPEEMAMRAPEMTDDELARLHYQYYGEGQGFAPPPQTGTMERQGGGLLELLGGAEAGYRGGDFQGLATFGSDIAAESARRQREADIQDVGDLAPGLRSAMEAADPLGASLLAEMGTQAQEELAARGDLTPRERRMAEQAARKAWTARGLVRDPQAVVDELSSLEDAQRLRKAERRGFAQQVMGQSKTMGADPFMAVLGRPSGAGQQVAQSGFGQAGYGLTAGPGVVFNPEAGLSYMLGQQQQQANLSAAQAQANATRQAGMYSGLGMFGGSIGEGLLNM